MVMPPGKRRPKGDASDVTTDDVRGVPPVSVPKIRHTDSEMSSGKDADLKKQKRFKLGSPQAKRAAAAAAVVGAGVGAAVTGVSAAGAAL